MAENSKEFGDRLGDLIERRGWNIKQLSEKIGVAYSAVWGYIKKGSIPEAPILLKLSKELGVSMEELLVGESREKKKTTYFDEEGDYFKAPLLEGKIAAGPGRVIPENEIKSYVWLYHPKLLGRNRHDLIAVEIGEREESMTPTLFPGDIVLIDRDDPRGKSDFKSGRIYGVKTKGGECQVKRVYVKSDNLIIVSDNREVPPENAWTDDLKRLIIGRVVWGWRNLQEV
jgi:phage repressor protein C with HTH and peptisase S24 domain